MSPLEQARAIHAPDGQPPLPYERWREIAPCLLARSEEERGAMLSRAGIDPETWQRADGFWSLALVAELSQGHPSRARDFGRACAEELSNRDRKPAAPQTPNPSTSGPTDAGRLVEPGPSSPVATPAPVPLPAAGGETAYLSPFAVPEPALPFAPARPGTSPEATHGPPPPARPATGTMELDPDAVRRALQLGPGKPGSRR